MDAGIFLIFDHKNIVSLLILPVYRSQLILEPIFKVKKGLLIAEYIRYIGYCSQAPHCGQVALGIGSWTSNLMNAGSIPGWCAIKSSFLPHDN